jgi:hypothetical protein
MAFEIPTTEPATLRAGDRWQWRREDLGDFPAPTWTLTYHFRNATSLFDVVASPAGVSFLVDVDIATTAAIAPGLYSWYALVSDGVSRHQVGLGTIQITPDVSAAVVHDGRSFPRRLLDAVEATLESRATAEQLDLVAAQGGDSSFTRDRAGLVTLRNQLRSEVAMTERISGGSRPVRVRFSRG